VKKKYPVVRSVLAARHLQEKKESSEKERLREGEVWEKSKEGEVEKTRWQEI